MKLQHIKKQSTRNSLCRVAFELDKIMYPLGIKEEIKYVEDIYYALNCKYSKVELANLLRRIMSYLILANSPFTESLLPLTRKGNKTIPEKDIPIIYKYIITNNQYIRDCQQKVY